MEDILIIGLCVTILFNGLMYTMTMRSLTVHKNYFDAVKDKVDYLNLWHLPGLIKHFEDVEDYKNAAICKRLLDDTKIRLNI